MNNTLLKKTLSIGFSVCKYLSLLEQYSLKDKAFILMYHRVLNSVDSQGVYVQPGMFVAKASFEKQIIFLKDRFEVILLEELIEKVLKGKDIGGYCAITFDDGWRDNFTNAFPILKKYQTPATIFLATGFVGTDKIFWPEELSSHLARYFMEKPESEDAPLSLIRFKQEIGRYDRNKEDVFYDKAIELFKKFSPEERKELLGYFRGLFDINQVPRQMLGWDEVQEMYKSGLIRFGSHTVNHEILDQIPLKKARDEISLSRTHLENHLGCSIRTFAYPNGNLTPSLREILVNNDFNAAVTTRRGFLAPGTSLLEIPRIGIHEDVSNTISMFRSRILFRKFW